MKIKYSGKFSGDELTDFCCSPMENMYNEGDMRGDIDTMSLSIYYYIDGVDGNDDNEWGYHIEYCPFCGKAVKLEEVK